MNLTKALSLAVCLAFGTAVANAGTVTYTCDPSVAVATCNYLNTTVAGNYSSTFTNANANIYITYGTTGLAQSEQYFNFVTYDQYVAALTANTSQSPVQVSGLSALNTYDAAHYGSSNVNVTLALASALGLTAEVQGGAVGITSTGDACTPGTSGCYNAIVTVTNDSGTPLYYDNLGGPEPADAYDFYGVVEHETDEMLGTSSCIGTAAETDAEPGAKSDSARRIFRTMHGRVRFTSDAPGKLSDGCGKGIPSAVDLYRYSAAGDLVLDSSLSTKPGAYFSYDGGSTNGANGIANTPKVYNTLANDEDYADFLSSTPDCGTDIAVQDAEGCPGEDKGLSILNDGRGEINILNAVGYDLVAATTQFELTTSANPSIGGTVTPASGGSYNSGTVVPITASPAAGYTFVNWTSSPGSVADPTSASTTITMNAAETVTANFQAGVVTSPVTASPNSISFGKVELCRSKKVEITLTNNGQTKVAIGPISFIDVTGNPGDFSDTDYCHNGNINAGASCKVAVKFSPSEVAPESATLNIVTNAPGSPVQVPITGTGTANKDCEQ
jgi:hypothetical protein